MFVADDLEQVERQFVVGVVFAMTADERFLFAAQLEFHAPELALIV